MKTCNRCKESKPLGMFGRNGSSPDGLYSLCKECRARTAAAYRRRPEVKTKEKIRLAAEYANNREAKLARRKARYASDPGRALAKNREWREQNLERHRELCRQWARENPDAMRAIVAKRRAIRNAADGLYTADDVASMLMDQGCKCALCQSQIGGELRFHVDHVIPLSRGGSNWPSNLQLLCVPCNLSKADKTPEEYAAYKDGQVSRAGAPVATPGA